MIYFIPYQLKNCISVNNTAFFSICTVMYKLKWIFTNTCNILALNIIILYNLVLYKDNNTIFCTCMIDALCVKDMQMVFFQKGRTRFYNKNKNIIITAISTK